ncbi:MAG: deoxyribose-phosphate aldolase [Oscillospiraceae bacterium]|nr:deoxyribose-phosphate aldolase [Oscillospiraceae bacterium]
MDDSYILSHVDHTLLAATATWDEIEKLCNEAVKYKTASVCIPPCYVKRVHSAFPELVICVVVGFPLGYDSLAVKALATQAALEDGAKEVDMVVNITDVKNGDFLSVKTEVEVLKHITGSKVLKVIIETCYLTEEEKISLCKAVTEGGADYIKTSTGFGTAGATLQDIELFNEHIGPNVKIKAAGGIRSRTDMVAYIEAGCSRLGTSSAIKILTSGQASGY